MAGGIKGITLMIGGDTSGLSKALTEVNKETNSLQRELREVERGLKFDPKNAELLSQKQKLLNDSIEKTREKLNGLKEAQKIVDEQIKNGTEVDEKEYRNLEREIAKAENQLKKLEEEARKSNSALAKIGEVSGQIGEKSTELGNKLKYVSAAAAGLFAGSTVMAAKFEEAIAKVGTIADSTAVPIDEMKKQITALSNETGIAAADIADNVYNAISAGQNTADAVNFVSNATKLARAGFTESSAALDILTTTLNAYGMSAAEVGKVSDLLIATQNYGKTTVAELAATMGKVIPTAKANNVEFKQLSAAYSILTRNGIATREATTYLNSALNELGKGGSKADTVLRTQTGRSFKELSADGKSLGDVLQILQNYASETGKNFTDLWGSSEAGKAALVLLGEGATTFNSELEKMNATTGLTDEAFAKMETTGLTVQKAINNLKNVMIDLGGTLLESVQPIIQSAAEKVAEFSKWFSSLDEKTKLTIMTVTGLVAGLAPLLLIIGKIATAISAIIALSNPIGAVVLGVGAAAAAIGATAVVVDSLGNSTDKTLQSFQNFKNQTDINTAAQLAELEQTEGLVNELYSLTDASGKVTGKDKERADFIANQLYEALGIEIDTNGNVRQSLEEIGKQIDDNINKKKLDIMLQGEEAKYSEALEARKAALEEQKKAYDQLVAARAEAEKGYYGVAEAEATAVLKRMEQKYKESTEKVAQYTTEAARYEEALRIKQAEGTEAAIAYLEKETDYRKIAADNEAKTLQELQNVRAREYAEAQKAYQIALDNYRASGTESDKKRLTEAYAFAKESRRAYEEAAKVVEDYSVTTDRYETAAALSVQGKTEKAIEYLQNENNYRKVYQTEQLQNFEEVRKARASSFDEAITTARVALDNYNRVQSDANRKNLEEALKNVEKTKAAYQRTGQAITNGTVEGINGSVDNLNGRLSALYSSLPSEFSGTREEFAKIGQWIPTGLGIGIDKGKPAVLNKLQVLAAQAKNAIAGIKGFVIGSPSKWAIKVGQFVDEGLMIGVVSKIDEVKKTFAQLFEVAEEEAERLTAEEEFYNAEVLRIEKEKNDAKIAERKAAAKNAEELQKIQSELEKEAEEARTKAYLEELKKKADIAKAQREEIKKAFEGMVSDVENQINDINSKIGSFSGGFQNYDLTEIKKDVSSVFVGTEIYTERAVLANLTKRREELEKFITNIKTLKNIGIDETMIEQIKKLGGENGAILAEALVTATPEQREVFISDFKKIAELSTEAAAEVYSDEIEKTAKNAINVLNELNPDLLKVGETWGDLLGTGLLARLKESLQNISGILNYMGYSGKRFIHGSDGGTIINNDNTVIQNITATPQTAYEAATETKRAMNDMWHRIIFE